MDIPKHLKAEGKKFYQKIAMDYSIDDEAGKALLLTAAESWERCQQARKILKKEGLVLSDRFGQKKAHPACAIERDSRQQVISALKALNLNPGAI
ncbi:MAG: P27 family phage terminase small subunit [Deltaproteobacteria bacterium]|nr:P27 family phage terminase small subunit [Deltaproteobacteria bacterium]